MICIYTLMYEFGMEKCIYANQFRTFFLEWYGQYENGSFVCWFDKNGNLLMMSKV